MPSNQQQKCTFVATQLQCIRANRTLFADLNFTLNSGQVLLVGGANGSGKTSLLRLLCGLRQADSGATFWNGRNTENNADYYAAMAYIGHLDGTKKELTVKENLQLAQTMALTNSSSIKQALAKTHMAGYENIQVGTLSAGQKRKIALTKLLLTNNHLWILDEPYTALDKISIALFTTLMCNHINGGGMLILSSHHDVLLPDIAVNTLVLGHD